MERLRIALRIAPGAATVKHDSDADPPAMQPIAPVIPRGATHPRRWLAFVLALLPAACLAESLLVFAAASLKPALDQILAAPDAGGTDAITPSYAASSQLARQIDAGAPAAVFISADQDWMDHLARRGLIVADSRLDLLGNALVLVAPRASTLHLEIAPGFDLAGALGDDGRLALAEPNSVPAGKYAKAALSRLGAWNAVESRIVAAENVRAALNFVARGEAPLGIVYRSDATAEPTVRAVDEFPAGSHAPIVYPAAIISGQDSTAARRLLRRLHEPAQQAIFRSHGFDAPPKP
jgi:molybdate transport system substrate-binding protein